MGYNLFLDDEREPIPDRSWVIVRNYEQAIAIVQSHGIPTFISFDHDLGTGKTGYDFAKYLVEYDLDRYGKGFPEGFDFTVHSANPIGKQNIEGLLNGYLLNR